ncbi:MAG: DUF4097 domain-containing protein [Tissierellales bacterium]|jgi:DUF4097 and DUF4098 domain-containing protein YvlB|nr:DUF4097 domain-containing protein [Tissierellales bacterium]
MKYRGLEIVAFIFMVLTLSSCSEIKIIENEQSLIVQEAKIEDLSNVEKIEIDTSITDVNLERVDSEFVEVKLETYDSGPKLSVSEGKVLRINAERESEGLIINVGFTRSPKLKISVPKTYNKSYDIELSTGDFNAEDIIADSFKSHSSTGDIYISKLEANNTEFISSTGDIAVDNLSSENISVDSSTGDVDFKNVEGNIIGESSTGDVTIEYVKFDYDLDYTVSTSDLKIKLNNDEADFNIDAEASVGDVQFDRILSEVFEKKDDEVKGIVGEGKNKLKLESSVGDIIIE